METLKNFIKKKITRKKVLYYFLKRVYEIILIPVSPRYPQILRNEFKEVKRVLRKPFWNMTYSSNLIHEKLEEEFAEYIGTKYAVCVNTGGMAIQMSLRALGIKYGDEIIHQVDTCVANPFAIIAAGGIPIFSDINPTTLHLDMHEVEKLISPSTKVIMPVHIWGYPEDMNEVKRIGVKYNLKIIEDACLAHGAIYKDKMVGSISDVGVFSFGCLKPIQAGEGGMITMNDEGLAKELRSIRSWGEMQFEYGIRDQKVLSWNGRISEVVAAIILEQLRAYPQRLEKILKQVSMFQNFVKNLDELEFCESQYEKSRSIYTQVVVKIRNEHNGLKMNLMKQLQSEGINVWHNNFEPLTHLSFFKNNIWKEWIVLGDIEKAQNNYNAAYPISNKMYREVGLGFGKNNFITKGTVNRLIKVLTKIMLRNNDE